MLDDDDVARGKRKGEQRYYSSSCWKYEYLHQISWQDDKKNVCMCVYYSLCRHLGLWYSSQVVATTEWGGVLFEILGIEAYPVGPHHNTFCG